MGTEGPPPLTQRNAVAAERATVGSESAGKAGRKGNPPSMH